MNTKLFKLIFFLSFFALALGVDNPSGLFNQLFKTITNALIASGANGPQRQEIYQSESSGISSSVYNALQTITKNDELQCVPRLLCEAVAGGKPGGTRQLNIDTYSLNKLISYLQLDPINTSPMLAFGRAVVLGLSNRGDPYSCIINYPKCPKDETRLLYYLNNHRGGFFRFFDMKLPYQNYQYGQNSYYTRYPSNTYKPSQYYYSRKPGEYKFKVDDSSLYAKKYHHSKISFPVKEESGSKVAFPSDESSGEPRIQTKPFSGSDYAVGVRPNDNFVFSKSQRYGKTVKEENSSFFHQSNSVSRPAGFITDRLPSKFHFPDSSNIYDTKFHQTRKASFFPKN